MLVQLLIITILFLVPLTFLVILLFFESPWGSLVTPMCICIVHLHLFFESLNLMYFIKPYRMFFFDKLLDPKWWKKLIIKKPPVVMMKPAIVETPAH